MNGKIDLLIDWVNSSNNIVFFGGAGVSTESGIPDYRSKDGLYNSKYRYPPETMLSNNFFMNHTEEFYDYYKNKMIYIDAKPNKAHYKLTELEEKGKLKAIITQNIDGLHKKALSKNVIELHGSIYRNYCLKCKSNVSVHEILKDTAVPLCSCGGIIRPDVVLYGEALSEKALLNSIKFIKDADMMIVGGTSLEVNPAASLLRYYSGKKLVLINKSKTAYDRIANLVVNEDLGHILDQIRL